MPNMKILTLNTGLNVGIVLTDNNVQYLQRDYIRKLTKEAKLAEKADKGL